MEVLIEALAVILLVLVFAVVTIKNQRGRELVGWVIVIIFILCSVLIRDYEYNKYENPRMYVNIRDHHMQEYEDKIKSSKEYRKWLIDNPSKSIK